MKHLSDRLLRARERLRLESVRRQEPLIGPETVQFHITGACNLACRYCYYHSPSAPVHKGARRHMALGQFKRIIKDCVDLQVDRILLSGEGEPSLHPRFYDMLSYLEGQPLEVQILSNGTFPVEQCSRIVRASLVRINLAAFEREQYLKIHGRDMFDHVLANIRELARLRSTINPEFRIETVFVMNRLNAGQAHMMELFCREIGVDVVQWVPVEVSPFNEDVRPSEKKRRKKIVPSWFPCFLGWFNAFVRLDGRLGLCCYMKHKTIADLNKVSFKEAWEGKAFARLRRMVLSGDFQEAREDCRNCREAVRNRRIALRLAGTKRT